MKKLYFFLMALMVAVCANAATGNYFISGNFNGWDHAQIQFDKNGTTYSVTLDGTGLKEFAGEFLICGGTKGTPDWGDKIGGVSNMEIDKEYTYTVGGGNMSIKGVIAYPVTITFNTATKKIKITGAEAENDYSTVYVIGDFGGGWSETRTDGPLSLEAGTNNTWVGDITFTGANNYFKMKAGAYVYGTGGGDIKVATGTEYTASQSGNAFVLPAGTYHFKFVLEKNADTGVLTVTKDGGDDPDPEVDYTGWYFNVPGAYNNNTDNGVAFNADGTATQTNLPIGNGTFYLKIYDGTKDLYLSGGVWSDADEYRTVEAGVPVEVQDNGNNNMVIAGATEGQTFNVTYNAVTNMMTVTPMDYSGYYVNVLGVFNDWQDNGQQPGSGDAENNYEVLFKELPIGTSDFKIKIWTGTAEDWRSNGQALTPWEWTPLTYNDDNNMTITGASEGEKYNLRYNVRTNEIVVWPATQTGIEEIAAEAAAEAVYYNMQGVRVAAPAAGIFIKVVGGKATKVAVK